jgi:hypothetical protein
VFIAIHAREPVLELLRSRVVFQWFDAVGVEDIPAVFAGEVVERLDVAGGSGAAAPQVMVSLVTLVEDVPNLVAHVHETVDDRRVSARLRRQVPAHDPHRRGEPDGRSVMYVCLCAGRTVRAIIDARRPSAAATPVSDAGPNR